MAEFLDMGGYARYVWSAFGVSLVALVLLYWQTRRAYTQALQRAARFVAASDGGAE